MPLRIRCAIWFLGQLIPQSGISYTVRTARITELLLFTLLPDYPPHLQCPHLFPECHICCVSYTLIYCQIKKWQLLLSITDIIIRYKYIFLNNFSKMSFKSADYNIIIESFSVRRKSSMIQGLFSPWSSVLPTVIPNSSARFPCCYLNMYTP